ncbi:VOC family protein [Ammoniphilus sp. YIM 78166]|uniref:VOC family protein n=1 Tax=Ammoniphilus sp. YIM 78166 TaxID=1644106 RepID=UPI001070357E|nr:VOC family protein [Ammoniphilus sp. YIM 78166]
MKLKRIDHISVSVQDVEKSKDFYGRILGLEEIPRPNFKFDGVWYKLGEVMIHVIHKEDSKRADCSKLSVQEAHLAFFVDSPQELDGIIEELEKENIVWYELENAPSGLRQLFFKDPDGYMIEIVTPDPANTNYESVYLKYYV